MSEMVHYEKSSSDERFVTYETKDMDSILILDKAKIGEPNKLLVVIIPD